MKKPEKAYFQKGENSALSFGQISRLKSGFEGGTNK